MNRLGNFTDLLSFGTKSDEVFDTALCHYGRAACPALRNT